MMLNKQILEDLACPQCGQTLILSEAKESLPNSVWNGMLVCQSCKNEYSVRDGVPYFAEQLREQEQTAKTFGFEWEGFWKGLFDKSDVFGLKFDDTASYFLRSVGLSVLDLKGMKILDAGTGSGRIPISIQHMGCQVYAVDIHKSLGLIAKRMDNETSVNVFQADLFNLPFKNEYFDVVWSSGVLMATPDAPKAFQSIASKVKANGRLFVSVYGKDLQHYRVFRHLLPFAHYFPPLLNYIISAILAVALYVVFNSILFVVRSFNSQKRSHYRILRFGINNIEYKSYSSVLLNLFDQLHPKFQTEHSVDEVKWWFKSNGFSEIVVTESIGMVAMRGIKVGR